MKQRFCVRCNVNCSCHATTATACVRFIEFNSPEGRALANLDAYRAERIRAHLASIPFADDVEEPTVVDAPSDAELLADWRNRQTQGARS